MLEFTYNCCVDAENEGVPTRAQGFCRICTQHGLNHYGKNAHCYDVKAEACQKAHKVNEPLVVSSTDTCTKPHTVMIKVDDAIIANVAMTRALWPENHA